MNVDLIKKISIAAFFHDIGKFAERANAVFKGDPDMIRQDYRYAHAYHTEQALLELFDEARLSLKLGSTEDSTVLNTASRHHKPRSSNPFEIIVSEADRIASGHERMEADSETASFDAGGRERKSKIPLISILSRIQLPNMNNTQNRDYHYPVINASNIFTDNFLSVFPLEEYPAEDVQNDYRNQWKNYRGAVKGLDPIDNFPTIFEISKMYMWCLPASTRKEEMPDVSLFDHLKATAAVASALYCYHISDGNEISSVTEREIRDRNAKKYLLFCGDISGIQKFIYQISSRGAYRALKGRSFFVQLVAELLARQILERCSLTVTNILYASGGKFYLLLPNTEDVRTKLKKLHTDVNSELFDKFNGDLYVRTGYEEISGADLARQSGRTLYQIWDDLTRQLVYQDRQRYLDQATENYDFVFGIKNAARGTCRVCHGPVRKKDDGCCKICREMEELGRMLGSSSHIVFSNKKNAITERYLFEFNGTFTWMCGKLPPSFNGADVLIMAVNDPEFASLPKSSGTDPGVNAVPFIVGSTHRFDRTFEEIAEEAKGIKRLGILRMDVDNLGNIFCKGLQRYRHETVQDERFHSLGRITTLSWQLSMFFGGIIPQLIQQNDDWQDRVTVVYSGGDDLFLLGAWDAMPDIARMIREKFRRFACNNPSFSLSGGMVITGGKFPVYKSAEMAGLAEEQAKHNITVFNGKEEVKKDSFTFLDAVMHWEEFNAVSERYRQLMDILEVKQNLPLLHRLKDIATIWQKNREMFFRTGGKLSMDQIRQRLQAERWQWLMVYALKRFSERHAGLHEQIMELQRFMADRIVNTERTGIELLNVLSRWCELSLRNR